MKSKTSITLDDGLLRGIDDRAIGYKSRSAFIEVAVEHFIRHLERQQADRKDLDLLNRHATDMNREAEDVLDYQVPL